MNSTAVSGWLLVIMSGVVFSDIVGIVRGAWFKERTLYAEMLQRYFGTKVILLTAVVYFYLLK
jgi:hypothetical protein